MNSFRTFSWYCSQSFISVWTTISTAPCPDCSGQVCVCVWMNSHYRICTWSAVSPQECPFSPSPWESQELSSVSVCVWEREMGCLPFLSHPDTVCLNSKWVHCLSPVYGDASHQSWLTLPWPQIGNMNHLSDSNNNTLIPVYRHSRLTQRLCCRPAECRGGAEKPRWGRGDILLVGRRQTQCL